MKCPDLHLYSTAEDRQVPTSTHPGDKRHRDPTLTSTIRTLDLPITEEQVKTLSFNMEKEVEHDTDSSDNVVLLYLATFIQFVQNSKLNKTR